MAALNGTQPENKCDVSQFTVFKNDWGEQNPLSLPLPPRLGDCFLEVCNPPSPI